MSKKLYVGNLPYSVNQQTLQDTFSKCGTVESVNVITNRDTGQSKGLPLLRCRVAAKHRRLSRKSMVLASTVARSRSMKPNPNRRDPVAAAENVGKPFPQSQRSTDIMHNPASS